MSRDAVIEFLRRIESDRALRARLEDQPSENSFVTEALDSGFDFSVEELRNVTEATRFMDFARRDADVRAALESAPDEETIVTIAARHGFKFTTGDLDAIAGPPPGELSETDLEAVSGGRRFRSFPDVCKTPSPAGPIPIPYPR